MSALQNKTVKKIIIGALVAFLTLLVIALIVNAIRLAAVNHRKDELAAQLAQLEQVINENEHIIEYCETPAFVEEYARTYLDMVRNGEIIIHVT